MDTPLNIQALTPLQKRALSYSHTLHSLFNEIITTESPADRVLARYFRDNKKHGSKDRKVIRETLFALFRWWGWIKKIQIQENDALNWYVQLSLVGLFEKHSWHNIIESWLQFAKLSPVNVSLFLPYLDTEQSFTNERLKTDHIDLHSHQAKQALLKQLTSLDFPLLDLVPDWARNMGIFTKENETLLIEAFSSRPPIWGRAQNISTQKALELLQRADIEAKADSPFTDSIHLGHKNINLNGLALYKQGQLEIQDLASQVIGHICAPKPNEHWWDACSGAGGKSLQLRSIMLQQDPQSSGKIIASDIRHKALEELNKRAKRAKYKGIKTQAWINNELPVKANSFDGVLVDAPCSCIGTWRRNPDLRWISQSAAVTQKALLQTDILNRSAKAVKVGGKLIYATCSLSSIENEDVVKAFLQTNPEYSLDTLTHPFTHEQHKMLTIWPFEANSDGMFVAKMTKNR
ncbi:methyltransferase domain-containing protein [uncultured Shewanella sp.]|uniref:RsmB/NOP family class I SAM-dependent RNA methyltransferase n=1 Tax=uncultured Shewanella sp. TaxID=173975 RepID=UPI002638FE42|nr:methyltransferase domain-containing protein [uncultured Shewanella sp.]